jgi:hypothetical protein
VLEGPCHYGYRRPYEQWNVISSQTSYHKHRLFYGESLEKLEKNVSVYGCSSSFSSMWETVAHFRWNLPKFSRKYFWIIHQKVTNQPNGTGESSASDSHYGHPGSWPAGRVISVSSFVLLLVCLHVNGETPPQAKQGPLYSTGLPTLHSLIILKFDAIQLDLQEILKYTFKNKVTELNLNVQHSSTQTLATATYPEPVAHTSYSTV